MQAVDYGIGCGHTKIAYIGGKKNFRSTKEREKGVLKSLKSEHPCQSSLFLTGDYSLESGLQNMEYLLSLSDLPTLVLRQRRHSDWCIESCTFSWPPCSPEHFSDRVR